MTNNQINYWAEIERERANKASEALEKQRIDAQRYAAQLSYSASLFNARLNYAAQMANINAMNERAQKQLQQQYDEMWFRKYGAKGLLASTDPELPRKAVDYFVDTVSTLPSTPGEFLRAIFSNPNPSPMSLMGRLKAYNESEQPWDSIPGSAGLKSTREISHIGGMSW